MAEQLYKILGLQSTATIIEVKKAKEYHPDKNKNGAEKFKEISNAYSTLCDPDKLSEYKRKNPTASSSSRPSTSHSPYDKYGFDFSGAHGRFYNAYYYNGTSSYRAGPKSSKKRPPPPPPQPAPPPPPPSTPPPPEKPPREIFDIIAECPLTLEQIYNGAKVDVKYFEDVDCDLCNGYPRQPNFKRYKQCERCEGSGTMKRHLDSKTPETSIRCVFCKGLGRVKYYIDCVKCMGERQKTKNMKLKTPKGIHKGHVLRVVDKGYLKPDGTKGTLIFSIVELKHAVFQREGDNLRTTVQISLKDAIMGFENKPLFTHLDGRRVVVTQTPGVTIRPNSQRRLRGEGMPIYNSKLKAYGDMIIRFEVTWQDSVQIPQCRAALDTLHEFFMTDEEKKRKDEIIVIDDDDDSEAARQERSKKRKRTAHEPAPAPAPTSASTSTFSSKKKAKNVLMDFSEDENAQEEQDIDVEGDELNDEYDEDNIPCKLKKHSHVTDEY
ncbi:hypothetical protein MBANPS3_010832 [Mucor bainieri]